MGKKFSNLTIKIFGKTLELRLEHRIANFVWFFSAIMGLISTIINVAIDLPLSDVIFTFSFFVLQTLFYVIAKKKGYFDILIIATIMHYLITISYGWINMGGSANVWESIMFASLILSVILARGYVKIIVIIAHVIVTSSLFFLEYSYPELIATQQSRESLLKDITSTFIFLMALLGLVMYFYTKSYATSNKSLYKSNLELNEKNSMIEKELLLARRIQEKLIPGTPPAKNIFSFYKPMAEVGGDLFDFFRFRDSPQIGIFISDVSGHGVPAAFITSMIKTIIVENGRKKGDPAALMRHLNEILIEFAEDKFVTAFYGIFDPFEKTLVYTCAGHLPPMMLMNNEIIELPVKKSIPLAVMNNDKLEKTGLAYVNSTYTLKNNMKMFLFTDGLTEAPDKYDRYNFFGYKKLFDSLIMHYNLPGEKLLTMIYKDLIEFTGKENFDDDICMIVVDIE